MTLELLQTSVIPSFACAEKNSALNRPHRTSILSPPTPTVPSFAWCVQSRILCFLVFHDLLLREVKVCHSTIVVLAPHNISPFLCRHRRIMMWWQLSGTTPDDSRNINEIKYSHKLQPTARERSSLSSFSLVSLVLHLLFVVSFSHIFYDLPLPT